jgi:hypothetical protein
MTALQATTPTVGPLLALIAALVTMKLTRAQACAMTVVAVTSLLAMPQRLVKNVMVGPSLAMPPASALTALVVGTVRMWHRRVKIVTRVSTHLMHRLNAPIVDLVSIATPITQTIAVNAQVVVILAWAQRLVSTALQANTGSNLKRLSVTTVMQANTRVLLHHNVKIATRASTVVAPLLLLVQCALEAPTQVPGQPNVPAARQAIIRLIMRVIALSVVAVIILVMMQVNVKSVQRGSTHPMFRAHATYVRQANIL